MCHVWQLQHVKYRICADSPASTVHAACNTPVHIKQQTHTHQVQLHVALHSIPL
jgi:hypothetical protein